MHFPRLTILIFIGGLVAAPAAAVERQAEVDAAVARGLGFLVRQQQTDGSFGSEVPPIPGTGLSLLALLSAGQVPERGRYGLEVRRAVDYLLDHAPEDGYFGRVDGSRLYGHGIALTALAEAYAVEPDAQRRRRILEIVASGQQVILRAQAVDKPQQHAGGWRYQLRAVDSDLSLVGWNVLALRAGGNIGVYTPRESAERAREYVLRCFRADEGGFAYQPWRKAAVGMTGVGIMALCLLDGDDLPQVQAAGRFLVDHARSEPEAFYVYSTYYHVQGAYQAGGEVFAPVWQVVSSRLLSTQLADGGWPASPSPQEPGRTYATAMAVLTLTVPYGFLPVYER